MAGRIWHGFWMLFWCVQGIRSAVFLWPDEKVLAISAFLSFSYAAYVVWGKDVIAK